MAVVRLKTNKNIELSDAFISYVDRMSTCLKTFDTLEAAIERRQKGAKHAFCRASLEVRTYAAMAAEISNYLDNGQKTLPAPNQQALERLLLGNSAYNLAIYQRHFASDIRTIIASPK